MKKYIIIGVLVLVVGLIVLIVNMQPVKIPVLTYHDFTLEETDDPMQIDAATFEKEMKYLADHHYYSLSLEEMQCFLEEQCDAEEKKSVLITMDDGWINELLIAAPILQKYNLHAVVFYVGEHLDDDNPNFMHREQLEQLQQEYPFIEVASHSYALHFEDADQLTTEELIYDMELMKEEIETDYYAYPYGKYSNNYIQALQAEDYQMAFTFGPDQEHRKAAVGDSLYAVPRLNMSSKMPFWKYVLRLNWYQ